MEFPKLLLVGHEHPIRRNNEEDIQDYYCETCQKELKVVEHYPGRVFEIERAKS